MLSVPKILINDDETASVKSGCSERQAFLSSKSSSESLFKYDAASSTPSPEPGSREELRRMTEVEDMHVPIPDCFLHSSVIGEEDFRQFARIKRVDVNQNRFGKVLRYVDKRTMIQMVATNIKLEVFDCWSGNPIQLAKKVDVFVEEMKVIIGLRHRRIAHLYGVYKDKERIMVFNEYLPHGSVYDKTRKHCLSERTAFKYFRQASEGLRYVHAQKLSHGNLKTTNLLLTISDDVKLSDFAVSQEIAADDFEEGRERKVTNYRMYLLHAAPESVRLLNDGGKVPPSADIWALGCVLVTMLTQVPPHFAALESKTDHEVYRIMVDNCHKAAEQRLQYGSAQLLPQASENAQKLLDYVMNEDQFERPTAEELLEHHVMQQNAFEFSQEPLFTFDMGPRTGPRPVNNGHIANRLSSSTVSPEPNDMLSPFTVNHNPASRRETTLIQIDPLLQLAEAKKPEAPVTDSKFQFAARFFGSRVLIFVMLMLKWALMVFLAAVALSLVASAIFVSISIIYSLIKVSCQCQLNEGFVVLIAIILLPILILLTTLCCNNACEKYHQARDNGDFRKSRFYVEEPQTDIILCGVNVIPAATKKVRRPAATKKEDSNADDASPSHVNKRGILNTIADLA